MSAARRGQESAGATRARLQFDAVLMPSDVMDGDCRSLARNAMPVALHGGLGAGVILESHAILAKTASAAVDGGHKLFKTTSHFDDTAKNAE